MKYKIGTMGSRKEIPITFSNERGKELVGIIHLPEKEKPPAVIICHGFQNHKTDNKFIRLARALREVGILVFRFDFEGCGDSEGDPKQISVAREVSDLNSAYRALLKKCNIDPNRIAFVGASLGAVVVSLVIERFKIPAKTLVFWSQAFNQKELMKIWYTKEDLSQLNKKGYLVKGRKEIGKEYWLENKNKDYSIILSKIDLPILLVHGKEDKDVPLEFSKTLAKKYKNVVLEVLPKADHKFEDFASQKKLIKLTLDWLKHHLSL